jgi:succinate dehydrogenase / fumarate reductase, cytochrome b subunit
MCKLCGFFTSSIGKKFLVGGAGLLLCGFLVTHLAGNLLLFVSEGAFNNYAKTLESNPLLPIAELGLAGLFLAHIVFSLWGRWQNKAARPVAYEVEKAKGGRTPGSRTMTWTALLVLAFIIIHIKTFKFGEHGESLYNLVMTSFANPLYSGFYVVAMLGLMLHLSHGVQSAFQTFGLNHPKYTPWIKRGGLVFALVIAGGFALIPAWAYMRAHCQ